MKLIEDWGSRILVEDDNNNRYWIDENEKM